MKNYIIFREYIKCLLTFLTEVMNPIMNLINETHDFCEIREYTFNIPRIQYNYPAFSIHLVKSFAYYCLCDLVFLLSGTFTSILYKLNTHGVIYCPHDVPKELFIIFTAVENNSVSFSYVSSNKNNTFCLIKLKVYYIGTQLK